MLPSPNGATLSLETAELPTFTGCLRNARSVAQALQGIGPKSSVIPAGERWKDGGLRPAAEDLIGAGAIIHSLPGSLSPEASVAEVAFLRCESDIDSFLRQCSSGKELIGRGFAEDVDLAAEMDRSTRVPFFADSAYVRYNA